MTTWPPTGWWSLGVLTTQSDCGTLNVEPVSEPWRVTRSWFAALGGENFSFCKSKSLCTILEHILQVWQQEDCERRLWWQDQGVGLAGCHGSKVWSTACLINIFPKLSFAFLPILTYLVLRAPAGTLCIRTLIEHSGRVFRLQFDEFQIVSSRFYTWIKQEARSYKSINCPPSKFSTKTAP